MLFCNTTERAGHVDQRQTLDDATIDEIFDRDPTIFNLLRTLLTPEQVENIMRRARTS